MLCKQAHRAIPRAWSKHAWKLFFKACQQTLSKDLAIELRGKHVALIPAKRSHRVP